MWMLESVCVNVRECLRVDVRVSVDRSIVYTRDEDEKEDDKIDTTNWRQRRIK